MQSPEKPRVFSGIQPSGGLHIGNYLGAIRNWVRDQDQYDNIFCIVDLHAITLPQDPAALRENTLDLAAIYLASGIKPEQAMFIQSHVSAHAELAWVFECFTPIGWLERMTQFKDRTARQGRERIGAGVLTYPSLMAADIMLYDAKYVPVGEDQRQHIEYTRDIGQRINQRYGNILVIPEPLIQKARAQTDAEPAVRFPAGPGVRNLLEIYRTIKQLDWPAVEREFEGKPYSALKSAVADGVIEVLAPIQQRYREIRSDDAALLQQLRGAANRLTPIANATLHRVEEAVGLR